MIADLTFASMNGPKKICQQFFNKWYKFEGDMFFLQCEYMEKVEKCVTTTNKTTLTS